MGNSINSLPTGQRCANNQDAGYMGASASESPLRLQSQGSSLTLESSRKNVLMQRQAIIQLARSADVYNRLCPFPSNHTLVTSNPSCTRISQHLHVTFHLRPQLQSFPFRITGGSSYQPFSNQEVFVSSGPHKRSY